MQEKVTQQNLQQLSADRVPVGNATSLDTTSSTKRRQISQSKAHLQRLDLVRRHVSQLHGSCRSAPSVRWNATMCSEGE